MDTNLHFLSDLLSSELLRCFLLAIFSDNKRIFMFHSCPYTLNGTSLEEVKVKLSDGNDPNVSVLVENQISSR